MKKLSLAMIGCVVLAGCTAPQQTTPPVMEKSALMPGLLLIPNGFELLNKLVLVFKDIFAYSLNCL